MSHQRESDKTLPCRNPSLELEMRDTLENLKEFALMMSFRSSIGSLTILSVEPHPTATAPPRKKAAILSLPRPGAPARRSDKHS
ncbi:MAG: hypothetical protein ACE5ET_10510 [Gammaproteobacteria bacterium]